MRIERMLSAAVAMCVMTGCGGEKTGARDELAFIGSWTADGDPEESGQNLVRPWSSTVTEFIRLDEGGTGTLVLWNYKIDARSRIPLTWSPAEGGIFLDAAEMGLVRRFAVEAGADSLVLEDEAGESYTFRRDDEGNPPVESAVIATGPFVLDSPTDPTSELVAQGSTVWFEIYGHKLADADGTIVPMDAVYSHPLASQDGDFWLTCAPCAYPARLQRRTIANQLVAELDLTGYVPHEPISSGAFDGEYLYVGIDTTEENDLDAHTEIWRVDPGFQHLIRLEILDVTIEAFTFHEGRLFAIVNLPRQVLVEIDLDSWRALRNLELPTQSRWQGLAMMDGELRLLGIGDNELASIATVYNL